MVTEASITNLRVPPHSIEAEQAVIGALMLDPNAFERVADRISASDFYRRDHHQIFAAVTDLARRGQPCDAVTLSEFFTAKGCADEVGGAAYVIELANSTPSAANVVAYAEIVREKSMLRRLVDGSMRIMEAVYQSGASGKSAQEILDSAIGGMMRMQMREATSEFTTKQVLKMAYERVAWAFDHPGEIPGITSGFGALDRHLGGFQGGDLTVFGARPAMGKTALLFGMARSAAISGAPVGVISAEMPAVQFGLRMLSLSSGVSGYKMRSGDISEEEWSRITVGITNDVSLPIWVYDRSRPDVAEVARIARRWKRDHGIKALYIDYLQRMTAPGEKQFEIVGAVAKGLKSIARDCGIPVIALAQVKREVESRSDKRPHMSDLSDSSEIEKEADQIIALYRDEVYNPESPAAGTAELLIDKNRHGACATVHVGWVGEVMRFADIDKDRRAA